MTIANKINIQDLTQGYDGIMFNPLVDTFVSHSGFFNYGYWDTDTIDQQQASKNLVAKLVSFIPEKQGRILDVACGRGASTKYLKTFYNPENIVGINISNQQLASARQNASGCQFLQMDAVNLDFPDKFFNVIICVEAAFHFDTREQFFKEAFRVLKPGGYLVLSDILMTLEAEQRRKFRTAENYIASLEDYHKILKNAGFTKTRVIEATRECWEGHYWAVVNHFHEKFFNKEISLKQLSAALDRTLNVVPDIMNYILVKAIK